MRTIASTLAAAFVSMALVVPVLAQGSNASVSAGVASTADLTCMSAAVDVRESAAINARATFNVSIMTALDVRRAALKAAYTIANNHDRMVAIEAAISAYAKAAAAARAKFSADVKAAWNVFATAKVNCHIDQNVSKKNNDKDNDHDDGDRNENRGLHLGWLKTKMNSKTWMNGHTKLDLSL